MSEPTTTRKVRITVTTPDRSIAYHAPLSSEESARQLKISDELNHAEIRFNGISDYTAEQVRTLLPKLVAERKIRSIEFIRSSRWMRSDGELNNLNGVILRGEYNRVELFVYGVSLKGTEPGELGNHVFDLFGVSDKDRQTAEEQTWGSIEYSVLIELL